MTSFMGKNPSQITYYLPTTQGLPGLLTFQRLGVRTFYHVNK